MCYFYTVQLFYLFFNQRECACASEGRCRRQENFKQTSPALPPLSVEFDAGPDPTTHEIVSWAKTKNQTLNQLSHPGALRIFIFLKKNHQSWGACVSQSVKHLPSAQVMISEMWDQIPHHIGLPAQWEVLLISLSVPPPVHALSLSLSLSNK